jgi:hypothetical protein
MPATDTLSASQIDPALEGLVHHTLEVMCFAEAERLPSLPAIAHPVEVRIDFSASHAGHLQIEVEPAAARALTAAFLGLEPSHPSLVLHTHDAMHELARVLCGRLVTCLDPTTPFETKPAALGSAGHGETIRQAFSMSTGTLRVTLQMS